MSHVLVSLALMLAGAGFGAAAVAWRYRSILDRVDNAAYAEGFDDGNSDRRAIVPVQDVRGSGMPDCNPARAETLGHSAEGKAPGPAHTIYPELAALAADETPRPGNALPPGALPAGPGFQLPDRWVALIEALDDPALFDVMMGART